ncbi:MAG: HD domain-containing protein [Chloroflexi bacterium]|nr:HD domain-containing protein [Chloroflexota bacterium]MDA1240281.1 HD domain-containing protein [Chloroflexota bacterium]
MLARAGLPLNARTLRALREHGVASCWVQDAAGADVAVSDPQATNAWFEAYGALADCLRALGRATEPLLRQPASRAVEEIRQRRPLAALSQSLEYVRGALPAFADLAKNVDASAGLLPDRHPADDIVGHSAHVALLTGRLGVAVGFSPADVSTAILAALLHDAGLLLVPEDVRRTPEVRRTPAEQRRYEDHAMFGEALLAPVAQRVPVAPLVAIEHHEQQAGGGYPNGIAGGNRILRAAQSRDGRATITLVSELVAVADRYERLTAGTAGEHPLSAPAARQVLAAEAGHRLNAEVVARLLEVLPVWALGAEVRLRGGEIEGARAVVVRHTFRRDRPVVRAFEDASGAVVEPYEVDLIEAQHVALEPVDRPATAPGVAAGRR